MNAPAPEAENEYSKGAGRPQTRRVAKSPRRSGASRLLALVALLGAALLVLAELRPLYTVHVTTYGAPPSSVSTGSHNAYALIPLALLAAGLAVVWMRARSAAAAWALTALGLIALLIALVGDLPDTRARGITHGIAFASTSAGPGLYLETLGAVLLLGAGGAAALTRLPGAARSRPGRPRRSGPAARTPRVEPGHRGESAS